MTPHDETPETDKFYDQVSDREAPNYSMKGSVVERCAKVCDKEAEEASKKEGFGARCYQLQAEICAERIRTLTAAPKAEPINEEPSAGGFTIGEQSTAWASTTVVCDWANTKDEQAILREITWQFEHLRNLVGVPLSVKVSKREASPKEPAPVAQEDTWEISGELREAERG